MNIGADCKSWEGQVIGGRFPLLQWLGGSEHSAVFLTELRGQEPRRAVIKLIPASSEDEEIRISRWEATRGLSHPHLIFLLHSGQCEITGIPLLYVVMEYAEEDLSQVLPLRPLTPAEAGEMLPPVVEALSYLHEKGLVHGHVQPSNIMVAGGQLKLSCDSVHATGKLNTSALEASVYDAPEATTGMMLPAGDVWSLGVTLVTALTQNPPTWEKSEQGDARLPASIPEPFLGIARKCLRRDPGRRCTLGDISSLLQPASLPLRAITGPEAAKRHRTRNIIVPIAAVLIGLVAFLAIRLNIHRAQTQPASTIRETLPANNASQASPTPIPEAATGSRESAVVQGTVEDRVLPDVPRKASNTIQGTVRVRVRVSVNSAGEVFAATLDSAGPSRYFAKLALEAAQGWKFHPPQVQGQSVASEWILQFKFRRTETQVDASLERSFVKAR